MKKDGTSVNLPTAAHPHYQCEMDPPERGHQIPCSLAVAASAAAHQRTVMSDTFHIILLSHK